MMWIGLVVGVVVGGLAWGIEGAITVGFIGWLTGTIVGASRKQRTPTSVTPDTGARYGTGTGASSGTDLDYRQWTVEDRLSRLEKVLVRVEERLARMDAGQAPVVTVAQPAPEPSGSPAAREAASESVAVQEPPPAPAPERPAFSLPPLPSEPPPPPPPPSPPHPIVAWFMGVNAIARVGMVILFFGLAFLIKYAAENQMLPPELRVAAVAAGGIALLFLGWRLRTRREAYALGLQGAGVAVLYLTVFGALKLYHLVPPELAFFLLAGIAVFSAALAILQNSVALAVIGASGGFLAPVLASTGAGNHVMLFSYYLILNLGVAAIAWFRAWRPLNLTAFLFTFGIGTAWGMRSYRPELLDSTEPFLIAFFLIFVAISVMVAREKSGARPGSEQGQSGVRAGSDPGFGRYVDGTLVFGVPLAGFGLQAGLMKGIEYGLSISSLVLAAFYMTLAWWLLKTRKEGWNLLAQAFLALGVVFVTLAIPLALDARWTSASWALEGAAIIWIGLRQDRVIARAFGYFLQVAAAAAYLQGYQRLPEGYPLVDAAFIGALLIAAAGYWIHWQLNKSEHVTDTERMLALPAFAWALGWTLFAGLDEIHAHVPDAYQISAAIMFVTAVATIFGILSRRWDWKPAAWTARALLPVLWVAAVLSLADQRHPLGNLGWLAWPLAFAALAWILRTIEPERRDAYTNALHTGWFLLAALLGAKELHWMAATYMARATAWSVAAPVIIPSVLLTIAAARSMDNRWPISHHARAYRLDAAVIIAVLLAIWSVYANLTHDGSSEPLPYIPLLNALDLAHLLAAFSIAAAWLALPRSNIEVPAALRGPAPLVVIGALAFIWVNGILLRTLSHYAGVAYALEPMAKSVLVQAALSIFWAMLALGTMVYATKKAIRPLWMVGVALLGVVVAKLFLFDLSNAGRIEQIVSFIAVGVLILVVGYFSPLPPKKPETA